MSLLLRLRGAVRAASFHFSLSLLLVSFVFILVFLIWYPYPYRAVSGGQELFLILIGVDLICGPILTLVVFNVDKPRSELLRDLSIVFLLQLMALGYGVEKMFEARPLFLVMEVDRFKVVASPDIGSAEAQYALKEQLTLHWPGFFESPRVMGLRVPKSEEERKAVLMESVAGGRDYSARPEFYLPYESEVALKSLIRAKALVIFLQKYPDQQEAARKLATEKSADITQWKYLPVVGRQDWIAILDNNGQIQGFLRGDGF